MNLRAHSGSVASAVPLTHVGATEEGRQLAGGPLNFLIAAHGFAHINAHCDKQAEGREATAVRVQKIVE